MTGGSTVFIRAGDIRRGDIIWIEYEREFCVVLDTARTFAGIGDKIFIAYLDSAGINRVDVLRYDRLIDSIPQVPRVWTRAQI